MNYLKRIPLFGRQVDKPDVDAVKGLSDNFYDGPPPGDLAQKTDIEKLFWDADGPVVHKWHHYLSLYERYFGPFRGKPVRMLEIGVFKGGSLDMWREWFGPELVLFGIDIDPGCAQFDGKSGQVRIGSQDDPEFLREVVAEMGGVDLILDDGSHRSPHIRASFDVLFPLLSEGGLYMIEDMHADFWTDYAGGYAHPGAFMTQVKQMLDDMHHWYHGHGQKVTAAKDHLAGVHVHDSIVVLEKSRIAPPRHSMRGSTE